MKLSREMHQNLPYFWTMKLDPVQKILQVVYRTRNGNKIILGKDTTQFN